MAEDQAGDDDGQHAGAVELLGDEVGDERRDERDRGVGDLVVDRACGPCRSRARRTRPTATPPTAVTTKSQPDLDRRRPCRPQPPMAVRSATSAVASLTRLSPCRIVTIRRGMPTRRAIAVAATASGGATTAPSAKPIDGGDRKQPPGDEADGHGRRR